LTWGQDNQFIELISFIDLTNLGAIAWLSKRQRIFECVNLA